MLVTSLPFVNPQSVGLPVADIPTQLELSLYANPAIRHWWRASHGFSAAGWACLKTGALLVPERTGLPDRVELSAYGGRPALQFIGSADQLWDGGLNFMPSGTSLSMVMVGRAGAGDNAFMMGGVSPSGVSTFLTHQSTEAAGGNISVSVNATAPSPALSSMLSEAAGIYYDDGPMLLIGSYDANAVTRVGLRANRGAVDVTSNPSLSIGANAGIGMHVGGINIAGNAASGPIDGGDIAEIVIVDQALHTSVALRDQIETMLHDRYGLW